MREVVVGEAMWFRGSIIMSEGVMIGWRESSGG